MAQAYVAGCSTRLWSRLHAAWTAWRRISPGTRAVLLIVIAALAPTLGFLTAATLQRYRALDVLVATPRHGPVFGTALAALAPPPPRPPARSGCGLTEPIWDGWKLPVAPLSTRGEVAHFVWNRVLVETANVSYAGAAVVRGDPFLVETLVPPGSPPIIVHVDTTRDGLAHWAAAIKPTVVRPVIIVACCFDVSSPVAALASVADTITVEAFLRWPMLVRLFAMNADSVHPKVTAIPIGIDYHSVQDTTEWLSGWGPSVPARVQEHALQQIRCGARAFRDRPPTALAAFEDSKQRPERARVYRLFHPTTGSRVGAGGGGSGGWLTALTGRRLAAGNSSSSGGGGGERALAAEPQPQRSGRLRPAAADPPLPSMVAAAPGSHAVGSASTGVYFYSGVSRYSMWTEMAHHAFIISPPGGGVDCHRTWEALALGCAVIVKDSSEPLRVLLEGLPVVFVQDWDDITPQALARWHRDLAANAFRMRWEKLTNAHWLKLVREAMREQAGKPWEGRRRMLQAAADAAAEP